MARRPTLSADDYLVELTTQGMTWVLVRHAEHVHPEEVHEALGTDSEAGLQRYLDQAQVADWYDTDTGRHLGPDNNGLALYWLDGAGNRVRRRWRD